MPTKHKTLTDLSKGSVFAGDFRIVEPLSAGGMGAVYIVEQLSTGKERALKLMHPELLADARLRERFVQEARVAALVESEHVVEVVSAGVDEATEMPWLAMELLRGESLGRAMKRKGRLSASEARVVFRQLCHAIGAAHRAKIVHRDLKPENIFLARTRRADTGFTVKVLDFGIAKIMADAVTTTTNQGSACLGTPLWMAPEQTTNAAINVRADVWSLGLIAFHALTGRHYWSCTREGFGSLHQLLREVLFDELASASSRAAHQLGLHARPPFFLPDGFDAWFAKCVARDETTRFEDATALHHALDPLLARAELLASRPIFDVAQRASHVSAMSATLGDPSHTPAASMPETRTNAPLGSGTVVAGVHTLEAARRGSEQSSNPSRSATTTMSPMIHPAMSSSPWVTAPPSPSGRAGKIVASITLGVAVSMFAMFGVASGIRRTLAAPRVSSSASAPPPTSSLSSSSEDAGSSTTDAGVSVDSGLGRPLSGGDLKKRGREAPTPRAATTTHAGTGTRAITCEGRADAYVCNSQAMFSALHCKDGVFVDSRMCPNINQHCKKASATDWTATIDKSGHLVCE